MGLWRGARDALMQWIGLLAATLVPSDIHASNNEFNDQLIEEYRCSQLLDDRMFIRRFYMYETLIRHNFVVFQTDSGHTYKVHLITYVDSKDYPSISVEIGPTHWKPHDRHVYQSNKPAWHLKRFVQNETQRFGIYQVGINDCRHFARAVAAFLAN